MRVLITIITFFTATLAFSQTSHNIDLIGQRNDHRYPGVGPDTSFHYSSLWGYTAPNGREYAFIGYSKGTGIYDITDAPNIVECDTVAGPESFYNYREFTTVGNYLYIVTEGTGTGKGLQVVNLNYLPDSVHLVTTWTFAGFNRAHTIKSSGNYLYINGADYNSGGVIVVDVTNPENPIKRGDGPPLYVHDCFIKNDTIYAANISASPSRMSVIDATNKDSLRLITEFIYPNAICHLVWTSDNRNYLVTSDEGGSTHARIWDSSDLFNITFVYEYFPYQPSMVHNSYFKGNLLFMAHYRAGVVVLNCSSLPSAPTVAGYYDTFNGQGLDAQGAWNVYPYYPSGKFVVSDMMTGLWVFKFTNSIGIEPISNEVPQKFKLYQNYPNPFNPSTKIKFDLPASNLTLSGAKGLYVKLIIYNILGREVTVPINEQLHPGTYEVEWPATSGGDNFPSGIYFYKLETNGYSETRKMVLLK